MPATRVRITGRVQGVGFRAYVMRLAREYHLRGEVWNCVDGSVGAVLQSENAGNIDRALQLLAKGPGKVEAIENHPAEIDFKLDGFSINSTRRE